MPHECRRHGGSMPSAIFSRCPTFCGSSPGWAKEIKIFSEQGAMGSIGHCTWADRTFPWFSDVSLHADPAGISLRNVTYRRPEEALFASDAVYCTQCFRNVQMRGTFLGEKSQEIMDKALSLQGAWILPKCCNLSSCASHRSRLTNTKSTA